MTRSYPHTGPISAKLLNWYDQYARSLPWRTAPSDRRKGVRPNPYHVWLSEIMLQQTTIPHATRYFLDFTQRWPRVEDLAAADRDDIMAAWAGLGYYSRARNLYACAQEVVRLGGFPETADELQKLPGIGPYTSGAIAAIAFDQPVAAVDGNVERVTSRLLTIDQPVRDVKQDIKSIVTDWVPEDRPGDFAQAMMDLGATVCKPRNWQCDLCPLMAECHAFEAGNVADYPVKPAKAAKPERTGTVYIVINEGRILLERRQDKGLLAGMVGLPGTDWVSDGVPSSVEDDQSQTIGQITHVFTHFRLTLRVEQRETAETASPVWVNLSDWKSAGLPSVFQKAVKLYLEQSERLL
ncbi:MAG: A/G-specific adenine glycosylase [Ponticaulis sp.]|nr:A/G-specific adenine glycosylase [Ponticaulis sp.]